ncbi:MAG: glycosyltransferase family 4 protein [Spirochaetales bacterium]|jgi:glycosyltransferase involved in cell wall biosynthesis|nr:glycosyltransferase family 4 protein [Spirochaetales bacterium]
MRILAVLPTFRPPEYQGKVGGGEISNRSLLEGLVGRGHEVSVVTLAGAGRPHAQINGVEVIESPRHGPGKMMRWLTARASLRQTSLEVASRLSPDIVLTATEAVAVALVVGKSRGVPVGVFIRAFENFPAIYPDFLQIPKRFRHQIKKIVLGNWGPSSLAEADLLIPNSEFMERCCREALAPVLTHVVYPPLEFENLQQMEACRINTVSMVGTGLKKGTELVKGLARRFPDLQFRIVGQSGLHPGQELTRGNLTLSGWCNVREEFEEKADIVIVPSLCEEAFGRVAVEGLLAGKIVLVSDIGGLPEAVHYEEKLCVAPGDERQWAERLDEVVANANPFRAASLRARSFSHRFSADAQVISLENVLYANKRIFRY